MSHPQNTTLRSNRKLHRRSATLLFLFLLFLAFHENLLARSLLHERFRVDIVVLNNGEIEVQETIRTRFTGSWNGINRFIPVQYRTPRGFSYKLKLDLQSITDGEGRSLRYENKRERHFRVFKIWIPGASGATKSIIIRYRVRNALRFFEEYDELYWNPTGDEGTIPIQEASTRIELPQEISGVRAVGFTGPYGSVEQATQIRIDGNAVTVQSMRPLNIREGLSVSVIWDPGKVDRPGRIERAFFFLADNWLFAIPLLSLVLMWGLWHSGGRDPRLRPIIAEYTPPDDLTPAEIGTLLDNSPDLRDITATLVDLAVRGFVLIEEIEEDQWFGLWSKTEYKFTLRKPDSEWGELRTHESSVLRAIFSGGKSTVSLSDLENKFYKDLPDIRDRILNRLIERRFYPRRPDHVKRHYLILAGAVVAGFVGLSVFAANFLDQAPLTLIVAGALTAASIAFFGWYMPARTLLGTRMLERILGFEEFLSRVESDRYRRMIKGPEMFEKYLPFAIALSVEKNWAAAFEDMYRQPPEWYHGSNLGRFHTRSFVSSLDRMCSRTAAVMASSPRSSGGSGSGGGGFSGGGFGGGGTSGF